MFARKKEEELKDQAEQVRQQAEELSEDVLDRVNGAGNPFANIPRVPTQPIDDKVRNRL